ncbi:MAG: CDP-diacylglycerol--serine O-phosphatidyltransferase [Polyangiaceae bacterium UTPRO1]|nr:MAG: CDP-diacylglycerol--serine O-phosphatidyltransferase [Polyangiaceae bacterium UTPRO1]
MHGRRERRSDEPLHRGVYLLPNLITTCGLFSGFYAIIATIDGAYQVAAVCILIAHVFDGLDGRIARLTKSTSRFGIEYDSLSDLVAFGVAPGVLAYKWALEPWGNWGWLAASLYVACGALRLARFNVQADLGAKHHFTGLPIPAAADTVASTVLLYYFFGGEGATHKHVILLVVIYGLAALMVSNVSYQSFKSFRFHPRQPLWILVALIVGLKFVIAEPQIFLFTAFMLYALSGPATWVLGRSRARRRAAEEPVAKVRNLR